MIDIKIPQRTRVTRIYSSISAGGAADNRVHQRRLKTIRTKGNRNDEKALSCSRLGGRQPTRLSDDEKRLGKTLKKNIKLTEDELAAVNTKKGLLKLLTSKNINVNKAIIKLRYEQQLELLQMELVKLQRDIQLNGRRVAIIFEGLDAAGKGGSIRRFIEHLNPRSARVVALPKPTEVQKGNGISALCGGASGPRGNRLL